MDLLVPGPPQNAKLVKGSLQGQERGKPDGLMGRNTMVEALTPRGNLLVLSGEKEK
jgi:hypothetical protein